MRLRLAQIRRRLAQEDGYTMIAVMGATALVTFLVAAAVAATQGDLRLTQRDLDKKRAYAAAQAGIADYSFHLNNDNGYWAKCVNVPTPNAVNQQNSTVKRRAVPGSTDASYAIQLIPASSQGPNGTCSTTSPTTSMLETTGTNSGTFRIRSIGYAGKASQAVVASYRRATLLDYIYFTQLETSDPLTYGFANPSSALTGAYSQCGKYRRDGRYDDPIPNSGGRYCDVIVFSSSDDIDGPVHTNDELQICGQPSFGRNSGDVIEVSAGPPGWVPSGNCAGSDVPNFVGPFVTNAPVLTPPPTNSQLKVIAGANTTTGQTEIILNGSSISHRVNGGSLVGPYPFPANGVIYVKNGACSTSYSPFTATYPVSSGCGNVIVEGSYSGQLTIAAENDVIIADDITRTGNGILGLIANNFVRVKHPICPQGDAECRGGGAPGSITAQTGRGVCNNGLNGTGTTENLRIDAALLAIDHSFIVDHYDCGASLQTLTVNGAIAQKYRGPVGLVGEPGYNKDYNYDDRLRYQEPPSFLNPLESAWHVQRLTLDFP